MSKLNDEFLEAFKRLDKVCREMYMADKGVTSYINDMENVSQFEALSIANWDTDLRRLKQLRHLRNQLSHEVETLNKDMCTQNDIDWLRSFYKRIFNQSDPLALLRIKRGKSKQQVTPTSKPKKSTYIYIEPEVKKPSSEFLKKLIFASICIIAVILAVIICKSFLS